ncbi:MAG: FKBP-type peptidyl-prolyl cis-trans isomerase [Bacteroidaceae bacterium]|nr:FKBP-type peptidyl-prolyl cis-trans isomerase [Bacteroidaceae bacterium]
MKKILLLILALGICTGMDAQKTKKKNKPKKAKTYINTITPVPADSASYAVGVLQAASLKQYLLQNEGVAPEHIGTALEALNAKMSAEEVDRYIAFAAGLKIARMNENMVSRLNQQLTGKADTTFLNTALMNQALADANTGKTSMLTSEQAMALMERQEKFVAEGLRLVSQKWLDENAQKEGVVTTASGLQYKVLVQGTGKKATTENTVEVHYEGSLIDGTVFDSSYKRNQTASFKPTQVIKGWTEALQLMPEGSTWELYIPYNLAYGEKGNQNIPPCSTLIFKVQVIAVK